MTLTIDIIDGRGLSNEAHQFLPKKSKVNAVFAIHYMVKGIYISTYVAVHY